MAAHIANDNKLLAIGVLGEVSQPLRIVSIGGPRTLKRVTTTGTEPNRHRRYYVTPDAAAAGGWKIVEIQVECAVCHGRGSIDDGIECSHCGATGWLKVPSTSSLFHGVQPGPNANNRNHDGA